MSLRNVLLIWELGGHLGHLTHLRVIAEALLCKGYRVTLVTRDLEQTGKVFSGLRLQILQGPSIATVQPVQRRVPVSFAELLLMRGCSDEARLSVLVQGWRTIYALIDPDIVFFEYAPIALIAAQGYSFRKYTLGNGFYIPREVSPSPSFNPLRVVPQERLERSERQVVKLLNKIGTRYGVDRIEHLYEAFSVNRHLLLSLPSLGHHQGISNADYLGTLGHYPGGIRPVWPTRIEGRVFAYLKSDCGLLQKILKSLESKNLSANIYCAGFTKKSCDEYSTSRLQVHDHPLDIGQSLDQSEMTICHGGHTTLIQTLLSGSSCLVIPMQIEQYISATKVRNLGLGEILMPDASEDEILEKIDNCLGSETQERCSRFATEHAGYTPGNALKKILSYCD